MGVRTRVMLILSGILLVAFAAIVVVIAMYSSMTIRSLVDSEMDETLEAVCNQLETNDLIRETALTGYNEKHIAAARAVASLVAQDPSLLTTENMRALAQRLGVNEIYITEEDGVVRWSTNPESFGLDLGADAQTRAFMQIITNPALELAQEPRPRTSDGKLYQYVGVSTIDTQGVVRVGVAMDSYARLLQELDMNSILSTYKVAMEGGVFIMDASGVVIADTKSINLGQSLGEEPWFKQAASGDTSAFEFEFGMARAYGKGVMYEGSLIVTYRPYSSMSNLWNTPVFISILILAVVFIILVNLLYFVLSRAVIRPMEKLYDSLNELKKGNRIDQKAVGRSVELQELTASVNDMLDRFESSYTVAPKPKTFAEKPAAFEEQPEAFEEQPIATAEKPTPLEEQPTFLEEKLEAPEQPTPLEEQPEASAEKLQAQLAAKQLIAQIPLEPPYEPKAQSIEPLPTSFTFEQLFHQGIAAIKKGLDKKNLKLSVYIDRHIPKTVIGDCQNLVQTIINLLDNAVTCTPENGSIKVASRLVSREANSCIVEIAVSDPAVGIIRERVALKTESES